MGEERIFDNAVLRALSGHDVDGVVQHGIADGGRPLRHEHLGSGVAILQERQRADVVKMRVGDENGIGIGGTDERVLGAGLTSLLLGVHPRIENHAGSLHVEQVAVGADFEGTGKIGEMYHREAVLCAQRARLSMPSHGITRRSSRAPPTKAPQVKHP